MHRRLLSVALLTLLATAFVPARAAACTCISGTPLCETFWKTDAVFSGEVLEISPVDVNASLGLRRRVRFRVLEMWRGTPAETVELTTGSGGGDCGYTFETGTRYLVFAQAARGGGLTTSICSRTQPLARASADLQYVRTAMQLPALGRIYGTLIAERDPEGRRPGGPLAGYTVQLSDGSRTWKATTGPDGGYEFTGLNAGSYNVAAVPRRGEQAHPARVTLGDARGCAYAPLYVGAESRSILAPSAVVGHDRTGAARGLGQGDPPKLKASATLSSRAF